MDLHALPPPTSILLHVYNGIRTTQPQQILSAKLHAQETLARTMRQVAQTIGEDVEELDFTLRGQAIFPGHWVFELGLREGDVIEVWVCSALREDDALQGPFKD